MDNPFVGDIVLFAGSFAPQGWHLCDGSLLPVSQNQVLYSLIGNTYGGTPGVNFNLPDLRGRIPVGVGQLSTGGGNYVVGSPGGTEAVTLTLPQIPQHTHAARAQSAAATQPGPAGAVWANGGTQNLYGPAPANTTMNPAVIAPTGGSQPHDNMMPFLPLNFVIATQGAYPPRS